jgi:protoheme IX farnesyltransferase
MIRALSRLLRPRLALLNGVAAVGGYLLFPAAVAWTSLWAAFCGVVILAGAGSVFNQVLERDLDRLMVRTRQRPLPNGDLTIITAKAIGGACMLAGIVLLGAVGGPLPAALGVGALVWYLAVYTPLKRRTPFALAIGGVCGAVPPVIGWCLAGGDPADYRIMLLAGLLYLWQIPHFWLFQRRHRDDYRSAALPLLAAPSRGNSLFWLWVIALIAGAMLLPAFGVIGRQAAICHLLFPLPLIAIALCRSDTALFSYLNLFPLMVTLLLFAQK